MKSAFYLFVVLEIAYFASVRILRHNHSGGLVQLELYWSAIRIVSICALAWLAKSFSSPKTAAPPLFLRAG